MLLLDVVQEQRHRNDGQGHSRYTEPELLAKVDHAGRHVLLDELALGEPGDEPLNE